MYDNIDTKPTIVYDPKILTKIKEMITEGFEKLKTLLKSKSKSDFEIYYELDKNFNNIALKLEKYEILHEELDYFLLTSDKILYIVYKNCENNSFGHYEFALDLFDFFIDIWNAKLDLLNNFSTSEIENHEKIKEEFDKKYFEFNKKFHTAIYEPSDSYCEKEIYKIMKSMRK